jgi:O-antigen/teichoic acid export membrane protein
VLWVLVILAGTGSISAGAVGPEIARVISGEEFLAAGEAVPNILLSAGFLAVLYVLTTAAGVIGRGSRVAWSVLAGAALQVAATPLLLSWLGIGGFAVASVLGRVAAVWLLGSAVRTMAPLGAGPLGAMVLLLVGTTGIQILNGSPDSTLVPRIVIAVTAAAVGAIVIVRLWTGRRFGHVSLAGSAE